MQVVHGERGRHPVRYHHRDGDGERQDAEAG
jgi:hypothetical protein